MHTALIIDEQRLHHDKDWFNRTVVGLLSAGIRVTRILPEREPDDDRISLAQAFWCEMSGVPWTLKKRSENLVEQLKPNSPDVIHAMGRGSWAIALSIANILKCPVILDVWSRSEMNEAIHLSRNPDVAGLFAAGKSIAQSLAQKVDPSIIQVVPIGVYTPEKPREPLSNTAVQGIVAIIMGAHAAFDKLKPLLDALNLLTKKYPELILFGDINPRITSKVWAYAKSLDVLDHISLIPSVEEHRSLVLNADMLLIPQPPERYSSFILQAMSIPLVTISVVDQYVDILQDPESTYLLESPSDSDWVESINLCVQDSEKTRQYSLNTRSRIINEYPVSRQINILSESYEKIVTGGSFQI